MSETTLTNKFSGIDLGKNWKYLRIILTALLILALILIVAVNASWLFYLDSSQFESGFDWREVSYLILTCTIVIWLKLPDALVSDMNRIPSTPGEPLLRPMIRHIAGDLHGRFSHT